MFDNDNDSLSKVLKELRLEQGLSQTYVAKSLEISSSTLSNYEKGIREPDYNRIKAFAEFYKVPTDYLFGFLTGEELECYKTFRKLWGEGKKQRFADFALAISDMLNTQDLNIKDTTSKNSSNPYIPEEALLRSTGRIA